MSPTRPQLSRALLESLGRLTLVIERRRSNEALLRALLQQAHELGVSGQLTEAQAIAEQALDLAYSAFGDCGLADPLADALGCPLPDDDDGGAL